jgi:hypothetical protein
MDHFILFECLSIQLLNDSTLISSDYTCSVGVVLTTLFSGGSGNSRSAEEEDKFVCMDNTFILKAGRLAAWRAVRPDVLERLESYCGGAIA